MPVVALKPLRGPDPKAAVRRLATQSRGVVDESLNEIGRGMAADLKAVTNDWSHKPGFQIVRTLNTVKVITDDKIFRFVDAGTRPHVIRPKSAGGVLVFQTGGKAKTRVNNTKFSGGKQAAGPTVFAREVHHPGTAARGFSRIIQARWEKLGLQIVRRRTRETIGQRNS